MPTVSSQSIISFVQLSHKGRVRQSVSNLKNARKTQNWRKRFKRQEFFTDFLHLNF